MLIQCRTTTPSSHSLWIWPRWRPRQRRVITNTHGTLLKMWPLCLIMLSCITRYVSSELVCDVVCTLNNDVKPEFVEQKHPRDYSVWLLYLTLCQLLQSVNWASCPELRDRFSIPGSSCFLLTYTNAQSPLFNSTLDIFTVVQFTVCLLLSLFLLDFVPTNVGSSSVILSQYLSKHPYRRAENNPAPPRLLFSFTLISFSFVSARLASWPLRRPAREAVLWFDLTPYARAPVPPSGKQSCTASSPSTRRSKSFTGWSCLLLKTLTVFDCSILYHGKHIYAENKPAPPVLKALGDKLLDSMIMLVVKGWSS